MNVLDRRFPTAVELQLYGAVLLPRYLWRGRPELVCENAKVLLVVGRLEEHQYQERTKGENAYQDFDMLKYQRMRVIKFVQGDMNNKVFLGQCHVLIHLRKKEVTMSASWLDMLRDR